MSVAGQSPKILGVYGQCPFACRYIQINSDHTFEELLNGDMFNNERKKGTWKYIERNKIKAESVKPNGALKVTESIENDDRYLVTVVDFVGAMLPNAEISGIAGGKVFKCSTDKNGSCVIPRAVGFNLRLNRFSGSYEIKNPAANRFQVELTCEQLDSAIDEIWLIEGTRLYVETDGSIDLQIWLEKVGMNRARKLFPNGN